MNDNEYISVYCNDRIILLTYDEYIIALKIEKKDT